MLQHLETVQKWHVVKNIIGLKAQSQLVGQQSAVDRDPDATWGLADTERVLGSENFGLVTASAGFGTGSFVCELDETLILEAVGNVNRIAADSR